MLPVEWLAGEEESTNREGPRGKIPAGAPAPAVWRKGTGRSTDGPVLCDARRRSGRIRRWREVYDSWAPHVSVVNKITIRF